MSEPNPPLCNVSIDPRGSEAKPRRVRNMTTRATYHSASCAEGTAPKARSGSALRPTKQATTYPHGAHASSV